MDSNAAGILQQIQSFDPASSPIPLSVIVAVGLVCGLVLWLFGKQVLKPIIAILGGAWGSAIGILAPTWFGISMIGNVPASLVGMGVGALIGALVGIALYRTLITFTTGLALGMAGLLVSLALLSGSPISATDAPSPDTSADVNVEAAELATPGEQTVSDATAVVAERAARFVRQSAHAITERFGTLSEDDRLKVLGSTLVGLLVGLIMGIAAPARASALVTASFGSGLWLYCFAWLSVQQSAPWADSLTMGPGGWAITWAIATAAGVGVQLLLWGRKAHTPKEAPAAA